MPFVESRGKQFEYFDVGEGDRIVILVHGAGSSAVIWNPVQSLMADAGFRTIAISLLGAGGSDRTDNVDDYNPVSYAADVRGAIDALEVTRCALVGHSLGVSNVLTLVDDFGVGLDVTAMILMAGGAGDPRPAPSAEQRERIIQAMQTTPSRPDAPTHSWTRLHQGLSEEVRTRLWRDIGNNPPERAAGQQLGPRADRTAFLNATNIPTLIVSGDDDNVVPLEATLRMYPKLKPDVRHLHVMHGVDHYPNAQSPRSVARVYAAFLRTFWDR